MRRPYLGRTVVLGALILSRALLAGDVGAPQAATTHTIFMNVVEYKGSTTAEKLAPELDQLAEDPEGGWELLAVARGWALLRRPNPATKPQRKKAAPGRK